MQQGIDVFDPFITVFGEHPDYDASDERREAEQLLQRQGAIEAVLKGEEHEDVLLDMLQEQGVSADRYLAAVEENIQYVIDNGLIFTSNDAGILLPQGMVI